MTLDSRVTSQTQTHSLVHNNLLAGWLWLVQELCACRHDIILVRQHSAYVDRIVQQNSRHQLGPPWFIQRDTHIYTHSLRFHARRFAHMNQWQWCVWAMKWATACSSCGSKRIRSAVACTMLHIRFLLGTHGPHLDIDSLHNDAEIYILSVSLSFLFRKPFTGSLCENVRICNFKHRGSESHVSAFRMHKRRRTNPPRHICSPFVTI